MTAAVERAVEAMLTDEDDGFERIEDLNHLEAVEEDKEDKIAQLERQLADAKTRYRKVLRVEEITISVLSVGICLILGMHLMGPVAQRTEIEKECAQISQCPPTPQCELKQCELRLCPGEKIISLKDEADQGYKFKLEGNVVKQVQYEGYGTRGLPSPRLENGMEVSNEIMFVDGVNVEDKSEEEIRGLIKKKTGMNQISELVIRDKQSNNDGEVKQLKKEIVNKIILCYCLMIVTLFAVVKMMANAKNYERWKAARSAEKVDNASDGNEKNDGEEDSDDSDSGSDDDDESESDSDSSDETEDKDESAPEVAKQPPTYLEGSKDDMEDRLPELEKVLRTEKIGGTIIDQQRLLIEENKKELDEHLTRVAKANAELVVLECRVELEKKKLDEVLRERSQKEGRTEEELSTARDVRRFLDKVLDECIDKIEATTTDEAMNESQSMNP